jgi:hypothetical protein
VYSQIADNKGIDYGDGPNRNYYWR